MRLSDLLSVRISVNQDLGMSVKAKSHAGPGACGVSASQAPWSGLAHRLCLAVPIREDRVELDCWTEL